MKGNLVQKLTEFKSIKVEDEAIIKKKQDLKGKSDKIKEEIRKIVVKPENIVPFLVPGRLIRIKTPQYDWGWGVLVSFCK